MPHPELASEQAYVDNAYARLDKMRTTLEGSQDRMATEFAAVAMEAWVKRRRRTFQDAERGLCFGRLALDGTLRPLYVGRRWVHDDAHEALIVNWQAPAARPFYTATPSDPQRVTQRRRFRTEGRRLVDISDEALDGSGVEGATVSDFLLEELDRRREGRMRDIVATIQSDQYRLITAEPEGALVVQGGPGTGKNVDGLFVSVRERAVRILLHAALDAGLALAPARERFRMMVLRRFYERYGELLGPRALRSFDDLERALRRNGFLAKYLDRVLPLP